MKRFCTALKTLLALSVLALVLTAMCGCSNSAALAALANEESTESVLNALGEDFIGAGDQTVYVIDVAMPTSTDYTAYEGKLCYDALDTDTQREAYLSIEQSLYRFTNEGGGENGRFQMARACVPQLTAAEIFMVKEAVISDHPECFWIRSNYTIDSNLKDGMFIILYTDYSYDDAITALRALENAVGEYLHDIPRGLGDYELEKYLHDRLVLECEYDTAASDALESYREPPASTAYGALVNHQAICTGYSEAFKLLCECVGIPAYTVNGYAGDIGHMWNLVEISGQWYHIDLTWNDPVGIEETLSTCYDYFNLSDAMMLEDHQFDKTYDKLFSIELDDDTVLEHTYNHDLPDCTSTAYNYYEYTALHINSLDRSSIELISQTMVEMSKNGAQIFHIKFSDEVAADGYDWLYGDEADPLVKSMDAANKKTKNDIASCLISGHDENAPSHLAGVHTIKLIYK